MIFSPPSIAPTFPHSANSKAIHGLQDVVPETIRESDGAYVEEKPLEPLEVRLVELMCNQWLSPQDALRLAGCFSLSQRVSELKREHGLPIVDEWRQVGRSRFKVYSLREGSA